MIIEVVRRQINLKTSRIHGIICYLKVDLKYFLTWEWLYYWWKYFKNDTTRLYILLARDENSGQIVGIAPLCIQKIRDSALKIKFLGTEKVASDFLNFIINPDYESEIVTAILHYLYCQSATWDLIEISDLEENSSLKRLIHENNAAAQNS